MRRSSSGRKRMVVEEFEDTEKYAFEKCKNLKKVTFLTTKLKSKSVGNNAFKGTAKNVKVTVPKKNSKAYKKFLKKKGFHKKAKYVAK